MWTEFCKISRLKILNRVVVFLLLLKPGARSYLWIATASMLFHRYYTQPSGTGRTAHFLEITRADFIACKRNFVTQERSKFWFEWWYFRFYWIAETEVALKRRHRPLMVDILHASWERVNSFSASLPATALTAVFSRSYLRNYSISVNKTYTVGKLINSALIWYIARPVGIIRAT